MSLGLPKIARPPDLKICWIIVGIAFGSIIVPALDLFWSHISTRVWFCLGFSVGLCVLMRGCILLFRSGIREMFGHSALKYGVAPAWIHCYGLCLEFIITYWFGALSKLCFDYSFGCLARLTRCDNFGLCCLVVHVLDSIYIHLGSFDFQCESVQDSCWLWLRLTLGLSWIHVRFLSHGCWIVLGFVLGFCWGSV